MGLASALVRGFSTRSDDSGLANPLQWLLSWASGGPTAAGINVNEHSALGISTVWACMRAISEDVSKIPLEVHRQISPDETEPVADHPLTRLLNVEANPEMDGFMFRETLTAHLQGWGNAYAEIERSNGGKPLALWPLLPSRTSCRRIYDTANPGGRIVYDYTSERRTARNIPAEDILHCRGLSFDGILGYSVIRIARESMALTMAAERFGSAFFRNGARPTGVLQHPGKLSPQAMLNLKTSFMEQQAGADNAGKPMIFEEGMTWVAQSIAPDEAQFLETRQFQPIEVCRWFRMPPHKIADLSRATFSNIEHQSLNYVDDTLFGTFTRWEREGGRKLFLPSERSLGLSHNADVLRRGDQESRFRTYALGRQWGIFTANDVLRMEGRPQLPPEIGGFTLVPVNMTKPELLGSFAAMGKPGQPAADPSQQRARMGAVAGAVVRAFQPAIEHQLRGCLRIEVDRARRADGQGTLKAWAAKFYDEHKDEVRGRLFPVIESMSNAIAAATGLCMDARTAVEEAARAHCEESRKTLDALAAGELEATVRGWEGARAELDAAAHVRRLEARTELALTGTVRT